jgi:hypothetical protein
LRPDKRGWSENSFAPRGAKPSLHIEGKLKRADEVDDALYNVGTSSQIMRHTRLLRSEAAIEILCKSVGYEYRGMQ